MKKYFGFIMVAMLLLNSFVVYADETVAVSDAPVVSDTPSIPSETTNTITSDTPATETSPITETVVTTETPPTTETMPTDIIPIANPVESGSILTTIATAVTNIIDRVVAVFQTGSHPAIKSISHWYGYSPIDTTKPEISNVKINDASAFIYELASNQLATNKIHITGNTDGNVSTTVLFWDMSQAGNDNTVNHLMAIGHTKTFDTSSWDYDLSDLNLVDGSYRVIITTTPNSAGNAIEFGEKTFTFSIDTTAPEAPVITSATRTIDENRVPKIITSVIGTCEAGAQILFSFDDTGKMSLVDCSDEGTFDSTGYGKGDESGEIVNSAKSVYVTQVDRVGNESPMSNVMDITTTSTPEVVITHGHGGCPVTVCPPGVVQKEVVVPIVNKVEDKKVEVSIPAVNKVPVDTSPVVVANVEKLAHGNGSHSKTVNICLNAGVKEADINVAFTQAKVLNWLNNKLAIAY